MLALKQEFQETLRESPFYLKPPEKKTDIERYSDKYQLNQLDGNNTWNPDWRRFPSELKWDKKKAKKVRFSPKPNISSKKPATATVLETLEKLEKNDVADEDKTAEEGGGDRAKDDDDEEEGEEEEYYEEDDLEEDTDYNLSYFDNGEEYGDNDDDDADEGPIY